VDGSPSIDLLAACRSAAVVCFRLEADSRPLMAQMLGAAIVQDLQSLVAALQSAPAPALVAIDEFSALGARQVTALFGRARSAGVSLLLGTQEVADLRLPGSERLLEQVMGNLSLLVAHRQVVPDSAELISRLAGTRGTWRVSWSSGRGTSRARSSEPVLDPESLMALAPGCGAVIGFGAAREVSVVRVRPERGER
jgi:conjugal transfer pilus assembly protein TraD